MRVSETPTLSVPTRVPILFGASHPNFVGLGGYQGCRNPDQYLLGKPDRLRSMSDFFVESLTILVSTLLVAIVTAYLTVRLSIRRFHSEKWWEKKQEAYSSLLESLQKQKNYAEQHRKRAIDQENYGLEVSTEEKSQLEREWKKYHAEYLKLRDLASLFLSSKAVSILDQYEGQKEEAAASAEGQIFIEEVEANLKATTACLEAIKEEAKRDLKVNN